MVDTSSVTSTSGHINTIVYETQCQMGHIPVPQGEEFNEFDILALCECAGKPHVMRMAVFLELVFRLAHIWMHPDIKDALKYMVLEPAKYVQYVRQIFNFIDVIRALINQTALERNAPYEKFQLGKQKERFFKITQKQTTSFKSTDPNFDGNDLGYAMHILFQHFLSRTQLEEFLMIFVSFSKFKTEDIREVLPKQLPRTTEFVGMTLAMDKIKIEVEKVVGLKGTEKSQLSVPLNWDSLQETFGCNCFHSW